MEALLEEDFPERRERTFIATVAARARGATCRDWLAFSQLNWVFNGSRKHFVPMIILFRYAQKQ